MNALRIVSWEPFRREPVKDCPMPEVQVKPVVYVPQVSHKAVARGLLQNIAESTPGGIRREQFFRRAHPVKTLLAAFPFLALVALCIVAIVTRHHG
jgi:hypothetical protein